MFESEAEIHVCPKFYRHGRREARRRREVQAVGQKCVFMEMSQHKTAMSPACHVFAWQSAKKNVCCGVGVGEGRHAVLSQWGNGSLSSILSCLQPASQPAVHGMVLHILQWQEMSARREETRKSHQTNMMQACHVNVHRGEAKVGREVRRGMEECERVCECSEEGCCAAL